MCPRGHDKLTCKEMDMMSNRVTEFLHVVRPKYFMLKFANVYLNEAATNLTTERVPPLHDTFST